MKLRLHHDTARLRLDRDDLARLDFEGRVEGATRFGPGLRLAYAVEASGEVEAVGVRAEADGFTVRVPAAAVQEWVETDLVGFSCEQPVGGGAILHLTVEKDFRCLHRDDPDEVATFSRPHVSAP